MNVKYRVTLSTSERAQLAAMVLGGKAHSADSSERRSCSRLTTAVPTRRLHGASPSARRPSIGQSNASSKKAWNVR